MEVNRPSQKTQTSRKGKRAWRKNVDIADVETGLEERREEIRTLGEDVEADELFTVDVEGDAKKLTKNRNVKVLRSTEILSQRSKAPALDVERNNKKKLVEGVSGREIHRLMTIAGRVQGSKPSKAKFEQKKVIDDPWDVEEPASKPKPEILEKFSSTSWTKAKVAPITMKEKALLIKEYESLPAAGKSYNPSLESWKALINEEYGKELTKEEQRQKLQEHKAKIEHLINSLNDDDIDASDNENGEELEEPEEEIGEDGEIKLSVNKPTETKIKTRAQRNKEKRNKEREDLQKQLKELKEQIKQIEKLPEIELELGAKPEVAAPTHKGKALKKNKLSKYTNIEKPIEVKLSHELSDSLRKLKPEGSALYDQMSKLQDSGKVEARLPVAKRRRYAPKITEKWTYKDFK